MKNFTKLIICFISLLIFSNITLAQFMQGDVFVSVGSGRVQWRTPAGALVQTLNNTVGGFTTGMTFDSASNLYVTNVSSVIKRFDKFGNIIAGNYGSGMSSGESILFDNSNNAYVGDVGGGIKKFDLAGTPLATYIPSTRVDWIDLAADNCTMFYTQEGSEIKRFNVCTNTAMSDFATGLGGNAFALRIRINKDVLVANGINILRLDSNGTLVQTYDVAGQNSWFALNLDPDGTSFWSADFTSANVYKISIATGAVLTSFNTGTGTFTVFGLAIKGEITAATQLFITVAPKNSTNPVGTQHCITATVKDQNGVVQVNENVKFKVTGANGVINFNGNTNGSGQIQFCYIGAMAGRDTTIATITSTGGADTAYKLWDNALPVEMASFTSNVTNRDVNLFWTTSSEENNSGFEIERSTALAGDEWINVGFVPGNGTTTGATDYTFTDRNLNSGKYNFRLKQIDFNGNFQYFSLSNQIEVGIPTQFNLSQNYPNPFNPSTKIGFELPKDGIVNLYVYDNTGKLISTIAKGYRTAGFYTEEFIASNIASGIYYYKLEYSVNGQNFNKILKMSLIK